MKTFLCVAMALGVLGCATSQPISNVVDAPIVTRSGKTLTFTEVAKAIERAGRYKGWFLTAEGPGLFAGRLLIRRHIAEVVIEHGTKTYSILYKDSVNLDARNGEIHEAYNTWIDRLNKAIRAELEML